MRSRPTLEVRYAPRNPRPGQTVRFTATVIGRSRTPIDSIRFHFTGREERMDTAGKNATYAAHKWFDFSARTQKRGLIEAGERRVFPAEFELPPDLPPAYSSSFSRVAYVLEVRVDIPWWPDRTARYVVQVRPGPAPAPKRAAVVYATRPNDKGVHLELTVPGNGHTLGGALTGAVSADHFAARTVRRLELAVVAMDTAVGHTQVGPQEVFRSEPIVVSADAPTPGIAYPFQLTLPTRPAPSFKGKRIQLRWFVEARAVVRFGRDAVLRTELHLAPMGKEAKTDGEAPPARVAPLGRERRALIWASVARRTSLELDAEGETMAGTAGSIQLTVLLETHDGRLSPTAHLTWPALGLDLTLTERPQRAKKPFDQRFVTHCRSAEQRAAVLTDAVRAGLSGFDRIALDDEGAELGSNATSLGVEALEAFVRAAQQMASTLDAAFDAVPPPPTLGPHREAWQAFAQRLGGRFQPGGFAIRDAHFKGAPVELVTRFDDAGEPDATLARALHTGARTPTPEAKRVLASLAREVQGLRLTPDAVEAELPCPLAEPARAESLWRAMARVVKVL